MRFWFVLLLAVSTVSLAPKTDNDPFDYSSFKTYYELNDSVQSNLKGENGFNSILGYLVSAMSG